MCIEGTLDDKELYEFQYAGETYQFTGDHAFEFDGVAYPFSDIMKYVPEIRDTVKKINAPKDTPIFNVIGYSPSETIKNTGVCPAQYATENRFKIDGKLSMIGGNHDPMHPFAAETIYPQCSKIHEDIRIQVLGQ